MDLQQALSKIRTFRPILQVEAVEWLLEHYETAKPALMKYLDMGIKEDVPDLFGHIYAMYIMAQKRDTDAFEPLLAYLVLPEDDIDYLLGDMLTEDFPSILASVLPLNGIAGLQKIYQRDDVYFFARDAAVRALVAGYHNGAFSRGDVVEELRQIITTRATGEGTADFMHLTIVQVIDLGISELYEEAVACHDLYADEIDFPLFDKNELEGLKTMPAGTAYSRFGPQDTQIESALDSLRAWPAFAPKQTRKQRKIGRNDPCPCDSGKKYKKCCLNREAEPI